MKSTLNRHIPQLLNERCVSHLKVCMFYYSWEFYSIDSGQQEAHLTNSCYYSDPLLGLQICRM